MFVAETKIMTDKGWKYISDISGHDKVLVRNFLGEAEFTQPFALKKSFYEGEIISFGNKDWGVSVTPEHQVVYNQPKKLGVSAPVDAKDVVANDGKLLYRRFRYNQESKSSEKIMMNDRIVHISMEDWYTIVAYTVLFGYIDKRKHPRIVYIADEDKLTGLTNILDMIGIRWSWNTKQLGRPQISLRNDSNLVSKLQRFLGSRARRDMRLPHKAVYGASASLLRHFVNTVVNLDGKPISDRPGQFSWVTTNQKLIENLRTMCLLGGYGFSSMKYDWGTKIRIIIKPTSSWNIREVKREFYSGSVYAVDLFDGLVYVTEKNYPVWMNPK